MRTLDGVRYIVGTTGMSMRSLSAEMGRNSNYLTNILSQSASNAGGVNSATLVSVAAHCGYVLAFLPEGDIPDDAVVLD